MHSQMDAAPGLAFLNHQQLHEVLFGFLEPEDVLNYRRIHSECDHLVVRYATNQVQDFVGQDLPPTASWDDERPEAYHRVLDSQFKVLDSRFLRLLSVRGDDIGHVLAGSANGVRTLAVGLIRGKTLVAITKALGTLCSTMADDLVAELRHIAVVSSINCNVLNTSSNPSSCVPLSCDL